MDSGEYYDVTFSDYQKYWSENHFHYGIWNDDTLTHEESLVNTVKEVTEKLDLHEGDIVLDAGCGVGGSSRYINEYFGVKTVGITLSKKHLRTAKELVKTSKYPSLMEFHLMDFTQTNFPNNAFTKIFAVESVCHAPNKSKFITEANRLLTKGGKLVVSDFFLAKQQLSLEEESIFQEWLKGWHLPNLSHIEDFKQDLISSGFTIVEDEDKTDKIIKSSQNLFEGSSKGKKYYYVLAKLRLISLLRYSSYISGIQQKKCVDKGIWKYRIITAEKL
jgi:cyclopropane fatty-acyl-phospholipid synthase-like methyltransferase